MKKKLQIGLVEDDPNIHARYKKYINDSSEMEVLIAVYSAESFLNYIVSFSKLDILLLDIELPGMSGLEAIRKIKMKLPDVEIVMLTTFNDSETIFKALRAGAAGYLLKDYTKLEFQKVLLNTREGGAPISPQVAKKIITYFTPPKSLFSIKKQKENITKTEKIVLHHLVKGLSYNEIANQMNVSINSVRHHIRNIYKKLQVNSRAKLIDKYKDFFSIL